MTAEVVIPWRPGCAHRERALTWVLGRLAANHPDWTVHVAEPGDGPWCKADAIYRAAQMCTGALVVVMDADVWVPNLAEAVAGCGTWAIPHRLVHRLDATATDDLIDTGTPGMGRDQPPYEGTEAGGILVLRRDVLADVPPDPRFVGWGQEDESWAVALHTLVGAPWRGTADLWHLWHPPQDRLTRRTGSHASRDLALRYRAAIGDRTLMSALVEEAKCVLRELAEPPADTIATATRSPAPSPPRH